MNVRPFKLLSTADIAETNARVDTAVRNWVETWYMSTPPTVRVHANEAMRTGTELSSEGWLRMLDATGLWIGLHTERQTLASLGNVLHGYSDQLYERASMLIPQVQQKAALHLARLLLEGFSDRMDAASIRSVQQAPPEWIWNYYSGAALCEIKIGHERLTVVLPPELIAHALPRQPSSKVTSQLASWREALQFHLVAVRAWVGEAEIDLEAMESIAVGDVIRLGRKIDEPLSLTIDRGEREPGPLVGGGFLGTSQGYKAIELINV